MASLTSDRILLWPLFLGAGWVAGFVDSIAGGGGLITVPVLLGTGLPPAEALATNKLQSTFGSGSAAWQYRRANLVSWKEAWVGVVATGLGALGGVLAVSRLDPALLRKAIPFFLLIVILLVWRRPQLGSVERTARMAQMPFQLGFGILLGFYDGFFGPGTGTFWMVAIVMLLGFEMLRATAWTKWMNFTSNAVALAAFACTTRFDWGAGLSMGLGQWLGARSGARVAMRGGSKLIRPVFLAVAVAATTRLFYDGWLR